MVLTQTRRLIPWAHSSTFSWMLQWTWWQEGKWQLTQLWLPSGFFAFCHYCGPSSLAAGPAAACLMLNLELLLPCALWQSWRNCCGMKDVGGSSSISRLWHMVCGRSWSWHCCCMHWARDGDAFTATGAGPDLQALGWIWPARSPIVWI